MNGDARENIGRYIVLELVGGKRKRNKIAPSVGIEPTTTWLKATRSTAELRRHKFCASGESNPGQYRGRVL